LGVNITTTGTTFTITVNGMTVCSFQTLTQPSTFGSCPLYVGNNTLSFYNSADWVVGYVGTYSMNVYRAPAATLGLSVQGYAVGGATGSQLFDGLVQPTFTSGLFSNYSLNMPYLYASASFNVTFTSSSSVYLQYNSTVGAGVALVSGVWSANLTSGAGITTVVYFTSNMDGIYNLTLTRLLQVSVASRQI
jgi:hypothetical protein